VKHAAKGKRGVRLLGLVLGGLILTGGWWFGFYENYHEVIPGQLYRSGQLTPDQLLRHAGEDRLKTVLNLRPGTNEHWHAQEVAVCERRGIRYRDFPIAGDVAPTRRQLEELVTLMRGLPGPILIHCRHGADRTGLAVALYLREIDRKTEDVAGRALSMRYGHTPIMKMFDEAFHDFCAK
jgi:protein tyrosine/serine phosphatase